MEEERPFRMPEPVKKAGKRAPSATSERFHFIMFPQTCEKKNVSLILFSDQSKKG